MTLDFTPLRNAVARLVEGWQRYSLQPGDEQIRDGLIKRFEFTYDLTHKSLRRALEAASASPEEVDQMSFPTMIWTAWEQGLTLGDWSHWERYRKKRNIAAHTYDEAKALEVTAAIPDFIAEAQRVLQRIEGRLLK
jgi:nucleotidyltransferase substrate binding protein (TIGR01987 family)